MLQSLQQEGFGGRFDMVGLQLLGGLKEVFEEQDDLSRVNVGCFEPFNHLNVFKRVGQQNPSSVQVEHLQSLHVVVRKFVASGEEHLLGLINPASVEEWVNLLLPADLFHVVDLRKDGSFFFVRVIRVQIDLTNSFIVCVQFDRCSSILEFQDLAFAI